VTLVMPFRFRRSAAVICIAIAVFATAVPITAWELPVAAMLTCDWLLAPPSAAHSTGIIDTAAREQLLCRSGIAHPRAPPLV
jgi:hypothetical protein